MTTTTHGKQLPYVEDTKQVVYIKGMDDYGIISRIYDVDIKSALSGEAIPTSTTLTEAEPEIRQDLIWGPHRQQSKTQPKENSTRTPTRIIRKDYYNYSQTIIYPNETHTIAAEIPFRQNKKKMKPPEERWRKILTLEKTASSKTSNKKIFLSQKLS